jgi:hypothetical protein
MDEQAFKKTYDGLNPLACPFEKAILICRAECRQAKRISIAERLAVGCLSREAQADCAALLELLRPRAVFALKLTHLGGALPHAKEVRIQCGGLLGLQGAVSPDVPQGTPVANIHALVQEAKRLFGGLPDLPFSQVVRGIAGFQIRRRSGPPERK